MRRIGSILIAGTFLIAVVVIAMSQERSEWRYSKEDDPLHEASLDKFVLAGKYLTPLSEGMASEPSLVVRCSGGKFKNAYLDPGTVVQHDPAALSLRERILGATAAYALVELRFEEKKPGQEWWEVSNDGRVLFFDGAQLTRLMTGRWSGHPSNTATLVRRLTMGLVGVHGTMLRCNLRYRKILCRSSRHAI
jgi:hypothetical protein